MTPEKEIHISKDAKILKITNEYIRYQIKDENGNCTVTYYKLLPGIELRYLDFSMNHNFKYNTEKNVIKIAYCLEGNIEWKLRDGSVLYCHEGDMQISGYEQYPIGFAVPLKYFKGILITVFVDEATKNFKNILDGFYIELEKLQDKYCSGTSPITIQTANYIKHIFEVLSLVTEEKRVNYLKIKILDLLLYLSTADDEKIHRNDNAYFSKEQLEKVKAIKNFVLDNINQHFTLNELSLKFDIPSTSLKRCFQGVYGMSIYSYMNSHRMHIAANMLRESKETITNIALHLGYHNPSKFSAAFKKHMGVTPKEYRRNLNHL